MSELLKNLSPYIKKYSSRIFLAILMAVFLAAIKFYMAVLIKPLFDSGLSANTPFSEALRLALIFFGLTLLNFPCRYCHFYLIRFVVEKSALDLRLMLFEKLQNATTGELKRNKQGEVISIVTNDIYAVSLGLQGIVDFIREPLIAIAMLSLAFYRDYQLTLVVLLLSPFLVLIFSKTGKRIKKNQSLVQEGYGEMTQDLLEGIAGQKVSRVFSGYQYILDKFNRSQAKYLRFQMKSVKAEELASPLIQFIVSLILCGVILMAHKRIVDGSMTTGSFMSFIAALALFNESIRKFSKSYFKMKQAQAAGQRIFGLSKMQEEDYSQGLKLAGSFDSIEFKNVTFSYNETAVVKDFSLKINHGQKVAIVGDSGSGKSTVINLLMRYIEPDLGEILIDGQNIKDYNLRSLREFFSYVDQRSYLVHGNIRENICFGMAFDESKYLLANQISGMDLVLRDLENGDESQVGNRGGRLSGGQKQKLSLARAFYEDNLVYLFDEATSALDNESERRLQKELETHLKEKTVVVIAHRLSTIQGFDLIVVMQGGELIESGHHSDLFASGGHYHKLCKLGHLNQ